MMRRAGLRVVSVLMIVLAPGLALLDAGGRSQARDEKGGAAGTGGLKPVAGTGTGTLKGKVTLVGDPPDLKALTDTLPANMDKSRDKDFCHKGGPDEVDQQVWRIDPKGGVANSG